MINKTEFLNNIKEKIDMPKYEAERRFRLILLFFSEIGLFLLIIGGIYLMAYFFELKEKDAFNADGLPIFIGFVLIFLVTFSFIIPCLLNKDFKNNLKEYCKNDIRTFFGLSMSKRHKLNRVELENSNLFSSFNTIECDDVLKGEYNGVPFIVEEMELRDINGVGKDRTDFLAFKGVVISFQFNKTIQSQTLITTRGDKNIRNYQSGSRFLNFVSLIFVFIPLVVLLAVMIPYICETYTHYGYNFELIIKTMMTMCVPICVVGYCSWILFKKHIERKRQMDDIKTEDISFDKRFCVYSKDQIEARYLVTPAFMERMKNLETAYGTKNIKCSFYEDKLLFAMSTDKDLFELGSLYSFSLMKHISGFYNQINSIYNIIDHFKLNEKTGL